MLTHQEAVDLQRFVDAVKASLPGYRESEQQREMMSAIADTFDRCLHGSTVAETDGANILVCESGTGTGKTFAYAIPGLVLARSVGKKLVISSSTVALQEQLAAKDLPFLQSCSPWPFSFAIAKGRGRYVCKSRLAIASEAARQVRLDDEQAGGTESDGRLLPRLARGARRRPVGRRPRPARRLGACDVWDRLTTDRNGCAGNRCPELS